MTLIPGITFGTDATIVFHAPGTLLGARVSFRGWFPSRSLSFSSNISAFIRFVICRANGRRSFQVYQTLVDIVVGKVLLSLEIVDDIIHRLRKGTEEEAALASGDSSTDLKTKGSLYRSEEEADEQRSCNRFYWVSKALMCSDIGSEASYLVSKTELSWSKKQVVFSLANLSSRVVQILSRDSCVARIIRNFGSTVWIK